MRSPVDQGARGQEERVELIRQTLLSWRQLSPLIGGEDAQNQNKRGGSTRMTKTCGAPRGAGQKARPATSKKIKFVSTRVYYALLPHVWHTPLIDRTK